MVDNTSFLLEYLFCCQFTTNDEILDLLEDLAMKRQKCSMNAKIKNYGENYHKLYLDVLKYFKLKDTINSNSEENQIKNWSSIRKKVLKDLIIKNFIIEVKQKYKFDETTTVNLKRDLMVGINFKNINDKNIVIEDNKIVQILGLNLSINSYDWDYDISVYN